VKLPGIRCLILQGEGKTPAEHSASMKKANALHEVAVRVAWTRCHLLKSKEANPVRWTDTVIPREKK